MNAQAYDRLPRLPARFALWASGTLVALVVALPVSAGEADVVDVKASLTAPGEWRFDVSVKHADSGWDHYADRWDVLGPDGEELGVRVLLHPHETEQPFTRSLTGVKIPAEIGSVTIRAHDSVHGLGGAEMQVPLQ